MEKYSSLVETWIHNPTVSKVFVLSLILLSLGFLNSLAQKMISNRVSESTTRYKLKKFSSFILFFLSLVAAGFVFTEKIAGLTVAIGIAGAGIAFALQEVIASFAGWFGITFGNFYKIGDRVQLSGIRGDVIDIGVLRTTLMEIGGWVNGDLYSGRVVRVANSFVFKEPVYNYSADFPFLWDEIVIPIRHGSDVEFTKTLMKKEADAILDTYEKESFATWSHLVRKYVLEDAKVDNFVTLTADASWMSFTLRYICDYKMRRFTKDLLFSNILEEIKLHPDKVKIAGASIEVTSSDSRETERSGF